MMGFYRLGGRLTTQEISNPKANHKNQVNWDGDFDFLQNVI